MHQRHGRRTGCLLRSGRGCCRRSALERATRGRRLELEVENGPFVPPSTPRSGFSKGSWPTNAQLVARRNPSRLAARVRSTSSNGNCSNARAPAPSSIPPGGHTRFRPAGITTCCVASNISELLGLGRTRAWTKRSSWSDPSGSQMARGSWRTPIPARSTSHSKRARRARRWNTLRALRVLRWYERLILTPHS